jgi:oligopeptide transport system permease protein
MLKDLSCPKCGAPLTIDTDGARSIVCKFCNTTAILSSGQDEEAKLVAETTGRSDAIPPVKGTSLWADAWKRLLKNRLAVLGMVVLAFMLLLVTIGPTIIRLTTGATADYVPSQIDEGDLVRSFPPSLSHPMGTDEAGRDLLARVLQGGRISLMVGIISTLVSLIVGVSYGAIAGYFGGRIDNIMMRLVDIIYAIPYILIVIVLLSVFGGPNTPSFIAWLSEKFGGAGNQGLSQIFLLFFSLGLISWLTMARVVRGQVLSLKNEEFVLAAKATGVSTFGIIFRHLVPNALGPVIVYATLTVPSVMLTEAFLSFLGMGVQAPYASWGSLAADGIKNIPIFPWQLIFPGVTMALTLFSLNFLGDGLRDALDPQTRKF